MSHRRSKVPADRTAGFQREVDACVAELSTQVPRLLARYRPVIVAAAMATHVSGALRMLMNVGCCTPENAREIFRLAEQAAFKTDENAPRGSSMS